MIQAFVGSGGKTGTIRARAAAYRAQGLRVLVTTTTHIGMQPDAIVGDDADAIIRALREDGYALAGQAADDHKIGALPDAVYRAACAHADVVLVEADGSRQMPLKYPAAYEPVIPQNAEEIIVVVGLSALGRPAREVCHRLELVKACLGVEDDTRMTPEHIETLLTEGYVKPLRAQFPDKRVTILPKQCDTLYKRALGALLAAEKPVAWLRPEWFEPLPRLVICGAGHVGQALAAMATQLDYEVDVVDDREEFASRARFPMARTIHTRLSELPELLGADAYCVVATRGHEADYQCVHGILGGEYAYLGMIGSKPKVSVTLERLRKAGISQAQLDTLHAPIGLPIGAQTPAEIAVSILAQIVQFRRARSASTASRALLNSQAAGVLCIITQKDGSTPRGVGSMMLVTDDAIVGTIGGGMLEHMAILDARGTQAVTQRLYDLSPSPGGMGMICGGKNTVLFIPLESMV